MIEIYEDVFLSQKTQTLRNVTLKTSNIFALKP